MSDDDKRGSEIGRRRFLLATGGALAGAACGGTPADDDLMRRDGGRRADGGPSTDAAVSDIDAGSFDAAAPTDAGTSDAGVGRSWLLPEGHYEGYFPLHVIYPRPDAETESYARHRHAYPGIPYEIPIGVQFGKWPYRYELVEGPAGARIVDETLRWNGVDAFEVPEGYGVVAWDVPAAASGSQEFRVRVYDQDHGRAGDSFVDVTWTTTVGTEAFVFLDPIGGDDSTADGSIDAPFRELGTLHDSGVAGRKVCYIRQTPDIDPDGPGFEGGYTPNPPTQLTFGSSTHPMAYVAFPGETVVVNTSGQRGFAQSTEVNHDVFFDGIVAAFTNQRDRNRDNVRVVMHWDKSHRSTFWRMGCVRAFGGTRKNDNHGFIWYWNAGGNVADATGHTYLYSADCWMHRMNIDGDAGSNGPHLWETYTTNRTLAERHRVTGSTVVNNGFVIAKGSARDAEIRACVTASGNSGQYHVRCVGVGSNGETQRVALCYNRVGARVSMGQAGSNPPYTDVYAYRNTCGGIIDAATNGSALSHAYHNLCDGVSEHVKETAGNIEHDGDLSAFFDDELRLVGTARDMYLGTTGAEVA